MGILFQLFRHLATFGCELPISTFKLEAYFPPGLSDGSVPHTMCWARWRKRESASPVRVTVAVSETGWEWDWECRCTLPYVPDVVDCYLATRRVYLPGIVTRNIRICDYCTDRQTVPYLCLTDIAADGCVAGITCSQSCWVLQCSAV